MRHNGGGHAVASSSFRCVNASTNAMLAEPDVFVKVLICTHFVPCRSHNDNALGVDRKHVVPQLPLRGGAAPARHGHAHAHGRHGRPTHGRVPGLNI